MIPSVRHYTHFADEATDIHATLPTPLQALKCPKAKRALLHLYSLLDAFTQSTALNVICPLMTFTLIVQPDLFWKLPSGSPSSLLNLHTWMCPNENTWLFSGLGRASLTLPHLSKWQHQVKILGQFCLPSCSSFNTGANSVSTFFKINLDSSHVSPFTMFCLV